MSRRGGLVASILWIMLGVAILMVVLPMFWMRLVRKSKLRRCERNLTTLNEALHAYALKHSRYPEKLNEIYGVELRQKPSCLAGSSGGDGDTYSPGYQVYEDRKQFTLCCKGSGHGRPDHPRIDKMGQLVR